VDVAVVVNKPPKLGELREALASCLATQWGVQGEAR
jgi:hypothetical protein